MQIYFGKKMVYKAMEQGEMHESAFGSVPGKNSQEALLEKELTFDMFRLIR